MLLEELRKSVFWLNEEKVTSLTASAEQTRQDWWRLQAFCLLGFLFYCWWGKASLSFVEVSYPSQLSSAQFQISNCCVISVTNSRYWSYPQRFGWWKSFPLLRRWLKIWLRMECFGPRCAELIPPVPRVCRNPCQSTKHSDTWWILGTLLWSTSDLTSSLSKGNVSVSQKHDMSEVCVLLFWWCCLMMAEL